MAWDDVLAGVGGAMGGADSAMRYYDSQQRQREAQELRQLIAVMNEQGRTLRAGQADLTKRDLGYAGIESREGISANTLRTRQTIAELQARAAGERNTANINSREGIEYGSRQPLGWANLETRQQIADQNNATSRANNQNTVNATVRGQDVNSATAQRGQNMNADLGWGNLQQRSTENLFSPTPNEGVVRPPQPSNYYPPPMPQPQAPMPVSPPQQQGMSSGPRYTPGQSITLRDGRQVEVDQVFPDGRFTIK